MQLHTPDSLMLEMPTIRDTRLHSSRQGTENGQQRDADTGVLPHHWRRRVKCLTSPAIFHQGGTRKRGHGGWYWRRGRRGAPRVTERAGRAPGGATGEAPGGGATGGHQEERLGGGAPGGGITGEHQTRDRRGDPKSLSQEGTPKSLSQAGGADVPQLRLRLKAGVPPPDAFGRRGALGRSWCEKEESGMCFLKDQADSSVGNARGEAGTAGGRGMTEMETSGFSLGGSVAGPPG